MLDDLLGIGKGGLTDCYCVLSPQGNAGNPNACREV